MTTMDIDKVMARTLRRLGHDWEKADFETTDEDGGTVESEGWLIIAQGQPVLVEFDPESMEFVLGALPIDFDFEEEGIGEVAGRLALSEGLLDCLRGVHCIEVDGLHLGETSAQCSLVYRFGWHSEPALRRDIEVGVEAFLQALGRLGRSCERSFAEFSAAEEAGA